MKRVLAALLFAPGLAIAGFNVTVNSTNCPGTGDTIVCSVPGMTVTAVRSALQLDTNWGADSLNAGPTTFEVTVSSDGYNVTGPMSVAVGGTNLSGSSARVQAFAGATGSFTAGPFTDAVFSTQGIAAFTATESVMAQRLTIVLPANAHSGGNLQAMATVPPVIPPPACTVDCNPSMPPPTTVPTLSQWALAGLSGLLVLLGIARVRRAARR